MLDEPNVAVPSIATDMACVLIAATLAIAIIALLWTIIWAVI